MPKDSKLDRCHDKVKASMMKEGVSEKEADRSAWAICKKQAAERKKQEKKAARDKALKAVKKW